MNLKINDLEKLVKTDNYEYLRQILIELQKTSTIDDEYYKYIVALVTARSKMNLSYICDTEFNIDLIQDEILKKIFQKVVDEFLLYFQDYYTDINQLDMTNNCTSVATSFVEASKEEGISCKIETIWPGYSKDARIYGTQGFHDFNIIEINGKRYIVDLSYKQFFKTNYCFEEEIGVPFLCAPAPGFFMMLDDSRRKIAVEILKKGYIEIKGDVLKHYCDGFTMSFRNKLFYDLMGNGYSTNYSDEDYRSFLDESDNQINHEPIKCIGPYKRNGLLNFYAKKACEF